VKKEKIQLPDTPIAKMNVEGMPWYTPGRVEDPTVDDKPALPPITKAETRSLITTSLLAALVIAGVFIITFGIFIGILTLVL
jgi:hypothetical protein